MKIVGTIDNIRMIAIGMHAYDICITLTEKGEYRAFWKRAHWKERSWGVITGAGDTIFETYSCAATAILRWIELESIPILASRRAEQARPKRPSVR